ncbi:hypothetical protein Tco_1191396 [Tanacetum coccineum]
MCTQVHTQAAEIKSSLKAQVPEIEKASPGLSFFIIKAWLGTTLKKEPKQEEGKKRIEEDEESDTESEEITEAKKKFDQIAHDEEVARKMQEEWEAEEERKRLTEEEATKTALSNEYDFIQARIEADRLLAERVQEAEREQFTVEERAKFLHDTIATQRRILAQQRSEVIRNKPPTKNQFKNQMMTYLKHVRNKKHADLKMKSFDEIKALFEKVKRFDDSFITIGSTEDERKIKEMNKGSSDPDKKKKIDKEDVSAKVPIKQDVSEQGTKKRKGGHMKMIARKRKDTTRFTIPEQMATGKGISNPFNGLVVLPKTQSQLIGLFAEKMGCSIVEDMFKRIAKDVKELNQNQDLS